MEKSTFPGRVALQQRVLPTYRVPFFDLLAERCEQGMSVFTGSPRMNEGIFPAEELQNADYIRGMNRHILSGFPYLCWQSGVTGWLSSFDPDLLIVEANPRYISNMRAIRWMHEKGRPVLGWGLGAPGQEGAALGFRQFTSKRFLKQFEGLIAYSSHGADSYRAAGVLDEKVFVAINSVSGPPSPIPAREALENRKVRILFVGRLQRRKRVDLLIHACSGLAERPELWIVGDGPARAELEELSHGIYSAAQFFGALHEEALEEIFDRADLFVLPGTGGLALQQAMAHALPCIAARGDGTQIDLVRPENGWLVDPDNLPALESALHQALAKPHRLPELGKVSWQIVNDEANIEVMSSVFIEAMNSVSRAL